MYCCIYVHSSGFIVKKFNLEDFDFEEIKDLYYKCKDEYGNDPLFAFDIMIGAKAT